MTFDDFVEPARGFFQGLIPRNLREISFTLWPASAQGMKQPVRGLSLFFVIINLRAKDAARERMVLRPGHFHNSAIFNFGHP